MSRPKLYHTDEQRRQAAREQRKRKYMNVALDADLIGLLSAAADKLEGNLGFRPTHSQVLRHLLKGKT